MNVVRNFALGLLLAAALTCVVVSAPPQNQAAPYGVWNQRPPDGIVYPSGPFNQFLSESAQLAKQYADSKKEDERREIRKKLTDVLTQQFDQHLQQQQKELEDLEKQIASLRAVLKKRLEAKSAIVERRIEQLIQDAEGLGWNAPGSPRGSRGFGSPFASPEPGYAPTRGQPSNAPKSP